MSPQVIAVDELGEDQDLRVLHMAAIRRLQPAGYGAWAGERMQPDVWVENI